MATGTWGALSDEEKAKYGNDRSKFTAAKRAARKQVREDRREYKKSDQGFLSTDDLNYNASAERGQKRMNSMAGRQKRYDAAIEAGDTAKAEKIQQRMQQTKARNKAFGNYQSGDINSYDAAAFGRGQFDAKDVAFLESEGYSKQQISDYANSLNRSKIHGSAQVLDGYDIHRGNSRNEDGSFNASTFGRNDNNNFGQYDMRAMFEEGLSEKEVAREMYNQMDTSTRGKKAQALLDKYISEFETDGVGVGGGTGGGTGGGGTGGGGTGGGGTGGGGTGGGGGGGGTGPGTPDTEQPNDGLDGGDGSVVSVIENSGNTTINDSFNGGTINTGDITAGGNVEIDNSNNAQYHGGDVNNQNITGGGGGGGAQQAQELLGNYVDAVGGTNSGSGSASSGIFDSGNTDIDNSFNGGDITTGDITAGGNVDIDNSNNSMYFGGDSSNINITYGADYDGPYSPMSALTMAGYGKPSDSAGSTAGFVAKYAQLNNNLQKINNKNAPTAQQYIDAAAANKVVNLEALNTSISQSIQDHYDRANIQSNKYFGNMGNYVPPVFNMPDPLKPIESNVEDIADDMEDNLS